MLPIDRHAVAQRIRDLLKDQNDLGLADAAKKLRVSELALSTSIDGADPHPTIDVLVAIVSAFGVDPAWLLTGEYDSAVHRQALADVAGVGDLLRAALAAAASPLLSRSDEDRV